ncbi:hypothetical protein GF318_04665 [Candidatus Micrarchaeota archaeon]|nr:hypothetical protein [Candidatus Micrarchaeota archaeon]
MKPFAILLILLSFSFAAPTFGFSRMDVERTWIIENGENSTINFTGSLIVNNSNQRVRNVTVSPGASYYLDGDGVVKIHYQGKVNSSRFAVSAEAVADISYDTGIKNDPPLPEKDLSFSNLTGPSQDIVTEARLLSDQSSTLTTIENMVNWVHENVEYDISCWGESRPASAVFEERRGVCVEYSHLLISMARSSGLETRYVSGYVYTNSWQPHAWVEILVPGYGWLPADATFAQAGILDSSHVAVNYGDDQSTSYDMLFSNDSDVMMSVNSRVVDKLSSRDPKGVNLSMDYDNQTFVVGVYIENKRPEYVFGTYQFSVPEAYGAETSSVLLLTPQEKVKRYCGLNYSLFNDGYTYAVPARASFNDAEDEKSIVIDGEYDSEKDYAPDEICMLPFAFFGVLLAIALH